MHEIKASEGEPRENMIGGIILLCSDAEKIILALVGCDMRFEGEGENWSFTGKVMVERYDKESKLHQRVQQDERTDEPKLMF